MQECHSNTGLVCFWPNLAVDRKNLLVYSIRTHKGAGIYWGYIILGYMPDQAAHECCVPSSYAQLIRFRRWDLMG